MGNRLYRTAFNGAEVLALPSGDPDYERSSGTPLLRCSVQGF